MNDPDRLLPVLRTAPDRRIRMSPREIRRARFAETRLGRRGYEREEVDRLLARVAEDACRVGAPWRIQRPTDSARRPT